MCVVLTCLNLFPDLDEILSVGEVCSSSKNGIIRPCWRQACSQEYDFVHLILSSSDNAHTSAALRIFLSYSAPNSTGSTEDEDTRCF